MDKSIIGFIGGGNMSTSIIGGLIADGYPADKLLVADPSEETCQALAKRFGISTETDNSAVVSQAQSLVLAVKPQVLRLVAEEIASAVQQQKPLIISIAAGIRSTDIDNWMGGNTAVVRTMPNTPALVQSAATGLFANGSVSEVQHEQAESILRAVGITRWFSNEADLDAVTALSGSGPAYIFYVIEALENSAINLGLDEDSAHLLAVQTAFGAAKLALESSEKPSVLRERVTSPGGTTERALITLREGGLEAIFIEALAAARDRATELADQFGDD